MSVYIPPLAGVLACLAFLLASPEAICGAFPARCASSCRMVAGMGGRRSQALTTTVFRAKIRHMPNSYRFETIDEYSSGQWLQNDLRFETEQEARGMWRYMGAAGGSWEIRDFRVLPSDDPVNARLYPATAAFPKPRLEQFTQIRSA